MQTRVPLYKISFAVPLSDFDVPLTFLSALTIIPQALFLGNNLACILSHNTQTHAVCVNAGCTFCVHACAHPHTITSGTARWRPTARLEPEAEQGDELLPFLHRHHSEPLEEG